MRGAGGRGASALVIVLGFIILATVLILAFFSLARNALNVTRYAPARVGTDALVRSAVESTVADLRLEMLAGAEAGEMENFDAAKLQPMIVRRPWAMVPSRVVSPNAPAAGFENLVKQSLAGRSFYEDAPGRKTYAENGPAPAAGRQRASKVNTGDPSPDGRILSPGRWDEVALTSGPLPENALPDWIYVTRGGVAEDGDRVQAGKVADSSLGNPDFVTGRFAYDIYDVGGLLDANAAGHPASQEDGAPEKGGLAWADLTALGLTADQVEKLMSFRHARTGAAPDFVQKLRYEAELHGFLQPLETDTGSDGFFYTRQDLLKFLLKILDREKLSDCTEPERGILASLTQDNRFSTAPSWNPSPTRPKIKPETSGGNNSYGLDDLFNPKVTSLKVLDGKEFTRLRFKDPEHLAWPEEIPAKAGEPYLISRFPLDRLRLITRDAVADKSSPIYRYFGLTRSSPEDPWVYNHGTSDPVRVLRLHEPQEGINTDGSKPREPDFVELLKVGIDAGSLGKSGGIYNGGSDWRNTFDQRVNYQLIQIFANLIDQFDADGYPTHIRFDGMDFYGVENLPYLSRVKKFMARLLADSVEPLAANGQPFSIVFLPEVWNPHDPALPLPADRPTKFRVTADTLGAAFPLQYRNSANDTDTYYAGGTAAFDPDKDNIILTDEALARCTEPVVINRTDLGTPSRPLDQIPLKDPWNKKPHIDSGLAGIASPAIYVNLDVPKIGLRYYSNDTEPGITFAMEYQDPSTKKWHSYLERTVLRAGADGGTDSPRGRSGPAYYDQQNNTTFLSFDPRTDRFSTYRLQERDTEAGAYKDNVTLRPDQKAGYGMSYNQSADNRQSPGRDPAYGWTMGPADPTTKSTSGGGTLGYAMGTLLQNSAGSVTRYTDPDGALRSGDGVLAQGSDKEGQMYWTGNFPSRPIVLNRPFRSVGEMGYAFRDTPGRSLDFFTKDSGDATLLDFFCVDETPADGVTSGRVSANTRNSAVVESLLRGALQDPAAKKKLASSRAAEAAQFLVQQTTDPAKGPLLNRAELATRFLAALPVGSDKTERIKRQREVFIRALADSMETGTWNLLIDLVVQAGRIPKGRDKLADFRVETERHVWARLSIDRMSGSILHLNIEPVHE